MKKTHWSRMMAILTAFACHIAAFRAEGEDDAIQLFKEYLHLGSLLTEMHLAEQLPPPHVMAALREQRDGIVQELLRNEATSGLALAREYEAERAGGGAAMAGQLLNFAMHTGIATAQFLPFARELVTGTGREDFRRPMLSTALEYLGEHGAEEDLELMARLDGRVGDSYLRIRDRQAARLKARLSGGAAEKALGAPLMPQAGPGVARRDDSEGPGNGVKRKASPSVSIWLSAGLSVAVLVAAILLVWARGQMPRGE